MANHERNGAIPGLKLLDAIQQHVVTREIARSTKPSSLMSPFEAHLTKYDHENADQIYESRVRASKAQILGKGRLIEMAAMATPESASRLSA